MEPITIILAILLLCILIFIFNYQKLKNQNEENKKYKNEFYKNKDFKCKTIDYYLMDDKSKLNYFYNELEPNNQNKLIRYAEILYKEKKP